jgi:CRISPR-associated endonuclease/helicase Cas3
LQQEVWQAYYQQEDHPALMVRAGTGTGKTEAAIFPALNDTDQYGRRRRIIIVQPSKALIEDMGERLKNLGSKLTDNTKSTLNITVDMGGSCRRYCCKKGEITDTFYSRHLFADDIILTTLDKFIFRIFGYGEKIKSFIFPHRIFGSALGKKPYIIFDEAHDYDNLAFSNFQKLLKALFIKGQDICVMSATIPKGVADFLTLVDAETGALRKKQQDFQNNLDEKIKGFDKKISCISLKGDSLTNTITQTLRANYSPEKRIIVRTEYIGDLQKLYEQLRDLKPLIYHGRLTISQRRKVLHNLIKSQNQGQGFLVLATSAIEAGCDLDVQLIITELCNPDSLVQLAGRLNRKGKNPEAKLIVVGDKIKPLVCCLDTQEKLKSYLQTLYSMQPNFDPQRLKQFFKAPQGDWMGEILFDMLWEYVYEGDLTSKPLWDRGILVTRSWEPAITLCTGLKADSLQPQNPVQVSISRLAKQISPTQEEMSSSLYLDWLKKQIVRHKFSVEEDGTWHADIYKAYFNPVAGEEVRWKLIPMQGKAVSCYQTNLVCVIKEQFKNRYFDPVLGYLGLPKLFRKGFKDGFKQFLDYHPGFKKDGKFKVAQNYPENQGRVWYLER